MNNSPLSKFEDKVVFRVSRFFWHVFTIIGSIAVVLGVAVWIWSKIPTTASTVERQAYPDEAQVKLSDFHFAEPKTVQTTQPTTTEQQGTVTANPASTTVNNRSEEFAAPDPAKAHYDALVDSLTTATPFLNWISDGAFFYPQGIDVYNYKHNSDPAYADAHFRQWQSAGNGLAEKWVNFFDRSNITSYADRITIIRGVFKILSKLDMDHDDFLSVIDRIVTLRYAGKYHMDDVILGQASSAASLAAEFVPDQRGDAFLWCLSYLQQSNGPDPGFIPKAGELVKDLAPDQQYQALRALAGEYEHRFNRDLAAFDQQLPNLKILLPKLPKAHQVDGLKMYFDLYAEKNRQRLQEVQRIDAQFAQQNASAQMDRSHTDSMKQMYGDKSFWAIGGGIILISAIALILAVLAIQRAVSALEQAVVAQRTPQE